MKPLLWASPENYPQKHFAFIDPQFKAATWLCKEAKEVSFQEPFVFSVKCGISDLDKWNIVLTDILLPLVRRGALDILQRLSSSECQFLPTTLNSGDNETNEFFMLNITATVDAIDLTKSEYKPKCEWLHLFNRIELLDNCMGDTFLAREKTNNSLILVHPLLKEEMDKGKIKGARFCPPSECGLARQQSGTP